MNISCRKAVVFVNRIEVPVVNFSSVFVVLLDSHALLGCQFLRKHVHVGQYGIQRRGCILAFLCISGCRSSCRWGLTLQSSAHVGNLSNQVQLYLQQFIRTDIHGVRCNNLRLRIRCLHRWLVEYPSVILYRLFHKLLWRSSVKHICRNHLESLETASDSHVVHNNQSVDVSLLVYDVGKEWMNLSVDIRIELHCKWMAFIVVWCFSLTEDSSVWCHISIVPVLIGNLFTCNISSVFFRYTHFVILLLALHVIVAQLLYHSCIIQVYAEVSAGSCSCNRVKALQSWFGFRGPYLNHSRVMSSLVAMVETEILQRLLFVKLIAVAVIVRRINIKDSIQIIFRKPIFLFGKLLIQVFSAHVMQNTDKTHVIVAWVAAAFKKHVVWFHRVCP